jgi:hypothetical protein
MLLRVLEQLKVPFREQNRLLLAAGYAPAYPERSAMLALTEGVEIDPELLEPPIKLLLQPRYLAQDLVAVGNELDVDVDGRISPPVENCRGSAREVDPALYLDGSPQLAHELLDVGGIG